MYTFDCSGIGPGYVEGDVTVINTHRCKLVMGRWKSNALRPQWNCLACSKSVWASIGYKKMCKRREARE